MSAPRYQPYPAYKYSGVEWLGQIPEGWEVKKLKKIANVLLSNVDKKTKESEILVKLCNYTDVYYNDIIDSSFEFMSASASKEQINKFQLKKNNVIITKDSEDPGDIAISALVNENLENTICGYHLALIQLNSNGLGKFVKYFFDSRYSKSYFETHANGLTRFGLGTFSINNIPFPTPSLPEQKKIAAFLDYETGKMDALIAKQQALIALLKEKRQAVISHAVTKGLDPNVPMRDSGIEWLGQIPAHWRIKKFSHCASIRKGQIDPTKKPFSDFILIAPNHVESGTGKILAQETAVVQGADSGKYLCKKGDVIYSKIRPALAKVCISPSSSTICSADMYPVEGLSDLSNGFLFLSLLSNWFTSLVVLESDRVAMPKINREKLSSVLLPIPPLFEQENITSDIKQKTSTLDRLLAESEIVISLIQERRAALISAAVTGKIDVRHWEPPADASPAQEGAA